MGKLMGAKIGSLHTLDDLGLYLMVGSPLISGAEPDKKLVQVPGGDFLLDLTRAVDGKVHYLQRTIRLDLKCAKPKKLWPGIQSALEKALQGQWLRCIFDDDPSWYWEGYWTVTPQSRDRWTNVFTISGICNPYKVSLTAAAGADWEWDTFNFETDIIYDTATEVKSL